MPRRAVVSVIARISFSNCDSHDVVNPQDVLSQDYKRLLQENLVVNRQQENEADLEETVQGISVCVCFTPNQLCRTGQYDRPYALQSGKLLPDLSPSTRSQSSLYSMISQMGEKQQAQRLFCPSRCNANGAQRGAMTANKRFESLPTEPICRRDRLGLDRTRARERSQMMSV